MSDDVKALKKEIEELKQAVRKLKKQVKDLEEEREHDKVIYQKIKHAPHPEYGQ